MPGGGTYSRNRFSGGGHVSRLGKNTETGRLVQRLEANGRRVEAREKVEKIIKNQPCLLYGMPQFRKNGVVTCTCVHCSLWKDDQEKLKRR